jgi:hypothetical protein
MTTMTEAERGCATLVLLALPTRLFRRDCARWHSMFPLMFLYSIVWSFFFFACAFVFLSLYSPFLCVAHR